MTAEKFANKEYPFGCSDYDFTEALKIFSRMKCKELLEIAAEKAEVENSMHPLISEKFNMIEKSILTESEGEFFINKDSILNAVDLDEFIK